jgi:hypothetical protein
MLSESTVIEHIDQPFLVGPEGLLYESSASFRTNLSAEPYRGRCGYGRGRGRGWLEILKSLEESLFSCTGFQHSNLSCIIYLYLACHCMLKLVPCELPSK